MNVDISFLDNIWIPDFYFYDLNHFKELKSFRIQGGLSIVKNEPNTGNENLFSFEFNFSSSSEVQFTVEAEVVFTCPINYSNFPFHEADCKLRLTSFSQYNSSMMYLVQVLTI